jgi:hypothetical protein
MKQAVMEVEKKSVNIHFERGVFQISAEIPVVDASEAIESLVRELRSQLIGEERANESRSFKIAPKELNEKDAAIYIGKSVSFLRTCRYKAKRGEMDAGPRYTRDLNKFIWYPVKELDDWLAKRRLFRTCLEERIVANGNRKISREATPNA